jgi:tetratricopeptide (TPR) repeat protein
VVLFTNRNRSLEEVGRWALVRAALDIGLPSQPTSAEADQYFQRRDWSNSAVSYGALLKSHPKDGALWHGYASALQRTHQCRAAIGAFRRAAKLSVSGRGDIHYEAARCETELGERERALDELSAAVASGFKDEDGELPTDGLFEPLWGDARFAKILRVLHPPR